jgi:hypothetical protein
MADKPRQATSEDLKWAGVQKSGLARSAAEAIEGRNARMKAALDAALGEDAPAEHACYSEDCKNRQAEKKGE